MTRKSAADVVRAVRGGTLDAGTLDKSVWRIKRLGVLTAGAGRKPDFDDNYAAAERLAEESAVLLKNDGLLPLSPGAKIALVGGRALRPKFQGGGSARMNARKVSTISDELRKYRDVTYAEGFTAARRRRTNCWRRKMRRKAPTRSSSCCPRRRRTTRRTAIGRACAWRPAPSNWYAA